MGMAVLAGGLAFAGTADAAQLILDGSFENVTTTPNSIVKTGGTPNAGLGAGWSTFSTYLYSTEYAGPPPAGSGANFLRPYANTASVPSSQTVTQLVSLTAGTTLTPAKIDAGSGRYTMSAWFSSYLSQGDYSALTLEFLNDSDVPVGESITPLGGIDFVAALPQVPSQFGKYSDSKEWGQDVRDGTIPSGARRARVTIQSTAVAGQPDGYVDLVSLDVTDVTANAPALKTAVPENNAIGVGPVVDLAITLQDAVTSVNANSIRLYLDNLLVQPTIQKTNQDTTLITYSAGLLAALSQHAYRIEFGDTGTPPSLQTNQFHFTVADYLTLPTSLGSPLGSEDLSKPGFNVSVYQVDPAPITDPPVQQYNAPPSLSFSEALIAGAVGTNIADLTFATEGNRFVIPDVINLMNAFGSIGGFPNDAFFPGIPGITGSDDSFAHEIQTFIRFPAAGYYQFGVNNEDQFRLTASVSGVQALRITSPTNLIIPSVVIATNLNGLEFGGRLPTTPLTGELAYATPTGNPDDACSIGTNPALAGKIVLLDRGGEACSSPDKAEQAQLAGAIAVLMITPGDQGFPFRLDGANPNVRIPVLVIAENYGGSLLKAFAANNTPVTLAIQGDPGPVLAEWDSFKSFGAVDVITGFAVPAPGVYPMRLVAGQEVLDANLEWFSITTSGSRILINDPANPDSLKAFRARTVVERPAFNPVVRSGNSITLSWTGAGTLEETTSLVGGSWTISPSQANPQTVGITEPIKFYRIRQ